MLGPVPLPRCTVTQHLVAMGLRSPLQDVLQAVLSPVGEQQRCEAFVHSVVPGERMGWGGPFPTAGAPALGVMKQWWLGGPA